MAKTNLRKQKSKSKLQIIFDKGVKFVCKSFIAFFFESQPDPLSFTIIASKKVGNAVKRNRSKRLLREVVRLYIQPNTPPVKLILIARSETAIVDFSVLVGDCQNLIKKINQKR